MALGDESIKDVVDRIIEDGQLTSAELDELNDVIRADEQFDEEEVAQVQRLLNMIQQGKLELID